MHVRDGFDAGRPAQRPVPASPASTSSSPFGDISSSSSEAASVPTWKNCVYFARGYCKHGSNCRFVHGQPSPGQHQASPGSKSASLESSPEAPADVPRLPESTWLQLQTEIQDLLYTQGAPVAVLSLPQLYIEKYGKNLLAEGLSTDASRNGRNLTALLRLLMRLKGTVTVFERSDGQKAVSLKRPIVQKLQDADYNSIDGPSSRQIYLTFPAESTFSEGDVASHFGVFGVVHDVRIPYQQKRMFGFVTFASPSSVKAVLKHGNPHYICGSRVLVKPYRERTKTTDRFKYVEVPRGPPSEPSLHQRGLFESKLPPRQLVARSETKPNTFTPRNFTASSLQSWTAGKDSQSSEQVQLSPPLPSTPSKNGEVLSSSSSTPSQQRLPSQGHAHLNRENRHGSQPQHTEALQGHFSDLANRSEVSNPVEARELHRHAFDAVASPPKDSFSRHPNDSDLGSGFENTPLPRLKLFHDSDDASGQGANQMIRHEEPNDTASPLEDWNVDLDSILPDSPFSSPKRVNAASSAPPTQTKSDEFFQEWHPSSVPTSQPAPSEPWMYGNGVAFLPPVNHTRNTEDVMHPKFPNHMMHSGHAMEDLSRNMAFLSMSQMSSGFPGGALFLQEKSLATSGARAVCTTCRQQVAMPNSQCECCQQLLCQNTHMNHLVQDFTPSWHLPVSAYVRTAPHHYP